ncbi:hypothetical protein [Mesorhizobium helmanticense]|uniref:hypothetical protein n=1 Tax=Mesorhizobium helmanticense TaxID=1776423 RepID=UPI0011B248C0|nr:hypothetical protein [Mesorhizobium helmanticense]
MSSSFLCKLPFFANSLPKKMGGDWFRRAATNPSPASLSGCVAPVRADTIVSSDDEGWHALSVLFADGTAQEFK